ncbi:MAG: MATE family efflux transporter [Deltaproteobacteria bacterium]|nr:MATE family efflux transporter [Deltaproteobacteria bacterium]
MDDRPIPVRLASLAWPIIGINVLTVLALAVDTAMCGRLPEHEEALTGLGFATQVSFLLMVAMMGLTVGTVATVARAFGAGHGERIAHVLRQSTQLTIFLGLLVAVVGNVVAGPILSALGASGTNLEEGLRYLRPMLVGSAFTYLLILYGAVCRGVGNTRLPFAVSAVQNLLNFVFNYGLILGNYGLPALGVEGAAIGTVASQAVAVILIVFLLRRGTLPQVELLLKPDPVDRTLAGDLIRIGTPAALDMLVLNAAFLSIVGMLGRIDGLAVAAHGIGLRIQALAFVPGMSIAQATGALVGQALGRGSVSDANKVVRASIVMATVVMSTLALAIVGAAHPIVALFDVPGGTPLHEYTVVWMKVLGYGLPIVGFTISLVGMLQGAGATNTSLRINVWCTLAFQIPLSWILGFPLGMGAFGVWLAFPISFVLKAIWLGWAWKEGSWAKTGARV